MSAIHRLIAGSLVVVAIVVATAGEASAQVDGRGAARTEVRGVVKSLDTAAGMITVSVFEGREQTAVRELTYPLAKDIEVVVGGGADRRVASTLKAAKLADLVPGVSVSLALSPDNAVVEAIVAEGPTVSGRLTGVDVTKNTITISAASASRDRTGQPAEEKVHTLTLAPDTEIAVDDGRGRRFSIREGKTADLATGALITVRMSLDQKQAASLLVEGPSISGVVKSVDPGRNSLTVSFGGGARGRGEAPQTLEQTVELSGDAVVLLDDGRGRRLSIKEGKLVDLPVGASVNVHLSVDQRYATFVGAEGGTLPGQIRAVDAAAGTITIARVSRGENLDSRTLHVAKDARIVIDGVETKLADIKITDTGPFVTLRLSLDQKTVQSIMAGQSR